MRSRSSSPAANPGDAASSVAQTATNNEVPHCELLHPTRGHEGHGDFRGTVQIGARAISDWRAKCANAPGHPPLGGGSKNAEQSDEFFGAGNAARMKVR